jgi:hypothetical protein
MKHYLRILHPRRAADRRAMSRIMAAAEIYDDGTATFHSLPMAYDDDTHPCRFRAGEDVYTPFGWNQLAQCAAAWRRNEEVFFEMFDN